MFTKDFKEIFSAQLVSVTGGLLAGSFLAFALHKTYLIPGLFIIVPGLLDMRGDISGSMSARLAAGLHLGIVKTRITKNSILARNVVAAVLLTIVISFLIGVVGYAANYFVFGVNFPTLILISVFAATLANLIEIPATVLTTFWLFDHGFDPNNVMGPYISTIGDIITVISLLLVVSLI